MKQVIILIGMASLLTGCQTQVERHAHDDFMIRCRAAGGYNQYNGRTNQHDCIAPLFSEQLLGD